MESHARFASNPNPLCIVAFWFNVLETNTLKATFIPSDYTTVSVLIYDRLNRITALWDETNLKTKLVN